MLKYKIRVNFTIHFFFNFGRFSADVLADNIGKIDRLSVSADISFTLIGRSLYPLFGGLAATPFYNVVKSQNTYLLKTFAMKSKIRCQAISSPDFC